MSQDKQSTDKSSSALNEAAEKGSPTSAADSSKDGDRKEGDRKEGNRKESGIAQPVDALRQPQVASNTTKPNTSSGSTSAMDSNKQASPNKAPHKSSGSRGIWGGIFLGLVLVAAALAAGLWWQQQRFETVAREVATRLQQSDQMLTEARDNASQALSVANTQRDLVDRLSRELAVTTNELKTLQQAWEAANEGLDQTLLLNDLERLINMANQELGLFGNVNSAVSILSSVNAMLTSQSAPALQTLQQAVITDLARLQSVPQVDVVNLSAKLDSLIQLTGKAPLLSPAGLTGVAGSQSKADGQASSQPSSTASQSAAAPAAQATESEQAWWQTWLSWDSATSKISQWSSEASDTLLKEFADVMSIRKADDPQALLLSEEQAIQLRANVRAMLLSAQLALMTRQADIWRSELNEVQSLLNTRYDTDALDTKASLTLLGELLAAPVAADVPQISDTLSALASAERTLNIPAEPQSSGSNQSDSNQTDSNKIDSNQIDSNRIDSNQSNVTPADAGSQGSDNATTTQGN